MKITKGVQVVDMSRTEAERKREYRARKGATYREKNAERMRRTRANAIPTFIGVDSEGIGRGQHHRAVLLGVGEEQYIAKDLSKGLHWQEVFEFLYRQYERAPQAAYVGFYLSYDFNQWLKTLPQNAAWMLLTKKGRAMRKLTEEKARRRQYHPVRIEGWEVDMLGFKRLSIRPRPIDCHCAELHMKCEHDKFPWMHICDAGPFFQMGFKDVLAPKMWEQDPEGPVCTPEEWKLIIRGKDKRATARLDDDMKMYNRLENVLLGRVMTRLARAFASIDIKPAKDEWYGPGATASKWLRAHDAPQRREHSKYIPDWFDDACRKSYFGGWFEIFSHGLIYGDSYNYDINNAYPYATTKLPHLCSACKYKRGRGNYEGNSSHVLLHCSVHSANERIGAMPHRAKDGSILRPSITKGWYWKHELDASSRAGLVKKVFINEWVEFIPCGHKPPFMEIRDLYYKRLEVGKSSAKGLAIKLNNNSLYGKFAQSVGSAPYNNWFYASYITSHCRTQILDAIATHPDGINSVLMVATDGICFDKPHPTLPITKNLGEWEGSIYTDLCLFKPGVYWHREGKEALLKVKSRGVPKAEFAMAVDVVEWQFRQMHLQGGFNTNIPESELSQARLEEWMIRGQTGWPYFTVPVSFRMKSCKQALNEGKWHSAATVQEQVWLRQDSDPQNKRRRPRYNAERKRIDTIIHDLPFGTTETKYYGEVIYPTGSLGFGWEGDAMDPILETAGILRASRANYDMPLGEDMEWVNVWPGQ